MPPISETLWLATLGIALLSALLGVILARQLRALRVSHAQLAAALHAAAAREKALREADHAKDEFFAMLGHELRNPLGTLAAAAQVLGKTAADPAAAGATAKVIERQVAQMTRLVEDLFDLSRVARGKVSLSRRPLELAALIERAVAELRSAGRLEGYDLRLELSPVWVRADEARLAQIVANLVGNALRYTPAGGRIAVSLRRDREQAVLRVRDNGIGMTPELAARVFDPFVQGERSSERGGLGLGLALVKHLAELHGGKAFAASAGAGEGSVFTVTLPACEADAEPAAQAGAERRRHRVVLVEDDDDMRHTLAAALALEGHEIHEAADGSQGLKALATLRPEVGLIDLGLPGLDGYQVAETLRGTPAREDMVLIALTGYGGADALRRAREAGFDEYVTKPIAPRELARLMDAALAMKARRAPRGTGPAPRAPGGR